MGPLLVRQGQRSAVVVGEGHQNHFDARGLLTVLLDRAQDPKALQGLARLATSVTLADGETRSLELKTTAVAL